MSDPFTTGLAPGALPLLGHARQLQREPLRFLESLPGVGDLVEIRLGRERVYVPCHPQLVRQILADDRTFDRGGAVQERCRELFGECVATATHPGHRRQRRLIQPAFHRDRLEGYAPVVEDEAAALPNSWQAGQTFDLFPVLHTLTLRSVVRMLFSDRVDAATMDEVCRLFLAMTGGVTPPHGIARLISRLSSTERRQRRAVHQLRGTVDRIVADYRRAGETGKDMLAALLAARGDSGERLDDTEVRNQAIIMLAAGSHSPATVLTSVFYLLAQHPAAERRLHHEVDAVLGGRPARWKDLPDLAFTGRVLTETLRLYAPAWTLFRKTTREVRLAGRKLPAGTTVLVVPLILHRRDDLFEHPREFAPDRWHPESDSVTPRGAFKAFGGGARKCVGDVLGMAELTLVVATIASRWRLECLPDARVRPHTGAVAPPPRYLPVRAVERHP
ncbi:cytochrome P450 [Streptomyces sp. ME19-01-6]|uniref:cytochrome P450 n=1 Tax=Streptomyces sp. ME19-01-6 TaxID=3028686 RepID=UPI0029BC9ADE|nr:cytochrome P450 [Streptomyces sp. ME19-01-6]MDX3224856.1 cytochrome P450 [Streptomyces sp. ME19-01-6]